MSEAAPRPPRRRGGSVPRQAAEGIGIVILLSLAGIGFGLLVAIVVAWVF